LDGFPEITMKISMNEPNFAPSSYHNAFDGWPTWVVSTPIDSSTGQQITYDPLSKLGLPLFPNGNEAIVGLLGVKPPYSNSRDFDHRFQVLIPDFQARIKSLRLARNKITLEVQANDISVNDLRAKVYCRSEDNFVYTSGDIAFQDNLAYFTADKEPSIIEAQILSTIDGESIDRINVDYKYPSR
jgi:hypothetical protein